MIILGILIGVAIWFAVDCIAAAGAMWLADNTGLAALEALDFWNWFAIVILFWFVSLPVSLSLRASS